jgi:hypothetical protein
MPLCRRRLHLSKEEVRPTVLYGFEYLRVIDIIDDEVRRCLRDICRLQDRFEEAATTKRLNEVVTQLIGCGRAGFHPVATRLVADELAAADSDPARPSLGGCLSDQTLAGPSVAAKDDHLVGRETASRAPSGLRSSANI